MSKYELDDETVRAFVADSSATDHDNLESAQIHQRIQDALEAQIPIPAPVKVGAVVRTARAGDYIRWAFDVQTVEPWIEARDPDLNTYRTDELGPIVEVLSPGVDL